MFRHHVSVYSVNKYADEPSIIIDVNLTNTHTVGLQINVYLIKIIVSFMCDVFKILDRCEDQNFKHVWITLLLWCYLR